MKRKKEFNFKEFILSALSKVSRTQWYYGVTFVLFSFFNFYLAQNNLAVHNKATGTVLQYVNFLGILFGISFLLLIPILSQFNFKKWFPLKLIVSYLVYNTLSYLTEITIYLNNPKYKVWNFDQNPFFRTDSFLVIFSVESASSRQKNVPFAESQFHYENHVDTKLESCTWASYV